MKLLTVDQILAADDRQIIDFPMPEWGDGGVYLQPMTSAARDAFEATMIPKRGKKGKKSAERLRNFRARLVSRCVVTKDGKPYFTRKQVDELGEKSAAPMSRLFEKCQEINGITKEDMEDFEGE